MAVGSEAQTVVDWGCAALALAVIGLIVAVVALYDGKPSLQKRQADEEGDRPPAFLVRLGALAAIGVGIWLFAEFPADCGGPHQTACPSYSLANPWILRGERGLAGLLGITVVVVLVARLLVQGRVPDTFGKDGFGWAQIAKSASREGIAGLEKIVQAHDQAIKDQKLALEKVTKETPEMIKALSEEVDELKG